MFLNNNNTLSQRYSVVNLALSLFCKLVRDWYSTPTNGSVGFESLTGLTS